MKNALKILIANFLVFIIVFGSIEAVARIVNSFHRLFMDHKTFRMKQSAPYKNAEYFYRFPGRYHLSINGRILNKYR